MEELSTTLEQSAAAGTTLAWFISFLFLYTYLFRVTFLVTSSYSCSSMYYFFVCVFFNADMVCNKVIWSDKKLKGPKVKSFLYGFLFHV